MGYTTDFTGQFNFNRPLTGTLYNFLKKFSDTRRMKRNIQGHGIDGEFFVDGKGFSGQDHDNSIVDYNKPPSTQPGLWCQWVPTEDFGGLEWDGNEKFYAYTEWLIYLIEKIFKPNDYILNGGVEWQGEDHSDTGVLKVIDNVVYVNNNILKPYPGMRPEIKKHIVATLINKS